MVYKSIGCASYHLCASEIDRVNLRLTLSVRDRLLIPQVLFFSVRENGGEGVETSENLKLEEKPEENEQNFRRMTRYEVSLGVNKYLKKHLVIHEQPLPPIPPHPYNLALLFLM